MKFPTVSIFDLPISQMNMRDTVHYLTKMIEMRIPHQVITANPEMVMTALQQASYAEMMKGADLLVPDGTGIVWAANYVGDPVAERVAGFDLMQQLLQVGNQHSWKVFLLGTSAETIVQTVRKVEQMYPGITIAGYRDGYFRNEQDEEVIAQIQEAAPDLLFVGRSMDKQEPWIGRYRHRLNVPVMMGVGGSFDIMAGALKRAPLLFQKLRLEWFYRLLQQPSRYRRMIVLPQFVLKVIRENR